jgi:hypothetical protein
VQNGNGAGGCESRSRGALRGGPSGTKFLIVAGEKSSKISALGGKYLCVRAQEFVGGGVRSGSVREQLEGGERLGSLGPSGTALAPSAGVMMTGRHSNRSQRGSQRSVSGRRGSSPLRLTWRFARIAQTHRGDLARHVEAPRTGAPAPFRGSLRALLDLRRSYRAQRAPERCRRTRSGALDAPLLVCDFVVFSDGGAPRPETVLGAW